jgi:sulfite exporter TauE/SafE
MIHELGIVTAFLTGLVGSVHCVGMCGGITSAFSLALPAEVRASRARLLGILLAYNGGRIGSYAVAGLLVGLLGSGLSRLLPAEAAMTVGRIIAALFMIALGLYLARWWNGLTRLEQLGNLLWQRLRPLATRLLPVDAPGKALLAGMLWGFLPCGMVYSMLAFSLTAGAAGAVLMVAFGLGTLPAMLLLGAAAGKSAAVLQRPGVRHLAGAVVILFGLATLFGWTPVSDHSHSGHTESHHGDMVH